MTQIIKLLLEFGPLVTFFLANSQFGIFFATKAFIIATVLSLVASRIILKKVAFMPLFTGAFVLVFGLLTIYLQNDTFIKIKPTIVNILFGSILLGGLYYGRIFLKLVFQDAFQLTDEGWKHLTVRWGFFFLLMAVLNEIVWRNMTTDDWVAFKVFGIMPITMIFGLSQIGLLTRHQLEESEETSSSNE